MAPDHDTTLYDFSDADFWRQIPAWKDVSRQEFGDFRWQDRHGITSLAGLEAAVGGRLSAAFRADLRAGLSQAPMRIRLTPYLVSLIDWTNPTADPIRRQFLPLASQALPDHPFVASDPLDEDADRVAPFLVHRYPDRALFLPLAICPVYCVFCTRSRLVGGPTATIAKTTYGASPAEWRATFEYLETHPGIEDVVVSGGDVFMLRPDELEQMGTRLLDIPHIRRLRFATRGLGAMPMRITSDDAWVGALARVSDAGRRLLKDVSIHTHINLGAEMTAWTVAAAVRLNDLGIRVRTQSVLLRGVNDTFEALHRLVKRLSFLLFQPYVMYLHDMVPGCEHLRTRLSDAIRLFKDLMGTTAGFNMPRFVCDAPGGGGKRVVSCYDDYDEALGISAWTAPRVKPGRAFFYYDPIDLLSDAGRALWRDPEVRDRRLTEFTRRAAGRAQQAAIDHGLDQPHLSRSG